MKIVLIVLTFLSVQVNAVVLTKKEKKPTSVSIVKRATLKLKRKRVVEHLRGFVRCCGNNKMFGTSGHAKVANYLYDQIKRLDDSGNFVHIDEFIPEKQHGIFFFEDDFQKEVAGKIPKTDPQYKVLRKFTDKMIKSLMKSEGKKGKNIIWEKKGSISPNDVIIIGAHYDTLLFNKETFEVDHLGKHQAADKNATGVAIALSLIELLSEIELPKTVRIIFLDHEELGFLGSHAYLKKYKDSLKKENVVGFVSLDSLGYDTRSRDKQKRLGNMNAYVRKENDSQYGKDLKLIRSFINAGAKMNAGITFKPVANGFDSSSHKSFWDQGYPALVLTQNRENDFNGVNHHTTNDFVETLNFKTLHKAYTFVSGAIITWAYDLI